MKDGSRVDATQTFPGRNHGTHAGCLSKRRKRTEANTFSCELALVEEAIIKSIMPPANPSSACLNVGVTVLAGRAAVTRILILIHCTNLCSVSWKIGVFPSN